MLNDEIFDPLSADTLRDPYPVYQQLRDSHPVYWHRSMKAWVLTRYSDCARVLGDSELFAADFRRVGIPTPAPILNLQTLDPPEHTPLRQFAAEAVHAQDLEELEAFLRKYIEEVLDELAGRDQIDFVKDFADVITLATICRLIGVEPPRQDDDWQRLNNSLHGSMDADLSGKEGLSGLKARATFNELIETWLANAPETGILGYVAQHQADVTVSRDVLISSVRAFWHAGFEVPSRFLGNAVVALLKTPQSFAALRSIESIDTPIMELARFAGPVQALSRACTQTTSLGDHKIESGDVVIALIAAANRDPAQFDRPEELILDRYPNPHLGFGRGPHSCLGAHLARIEARLVFRTLVKKYPDMRLVGEPTPQPNATLRGMLNIPVTLGSPRPDSPFPGDAQPTHEPIATTI